MTTNRRRPPLGIYIHMPFCMKKCGYCDFLSFDDKPEASHKAYVGALVREIRTYGNYVADTVFIGGGTPSAIDPGLISDVMTAVKQSFSLTPGAEITIEANPGTLSEKKLNSYLDSGINRLSIGVQSFDGDLLWTLGRAHSVGDIAKGFEMARSAGFKNINIDLIFGIPGQDAAMWEDTLERATWLEPEHISFYGLQAEEGTVLYEKLQAGALKAVSDELDREMYHSAARKLRGAGYERYEISNAAKAGHECRHNVKYWSMEDYIGLGLGAHSYFAGERFGNITDFDAYVGRGGELAREWRYVNSISDDISEYMFTGLRMMKGISLEDFEKRFNNPIKAVFHHEWPEVERFIEGGFLNVDGGMMRLTAKGIDISNRIMSEFILLDG